MAKKKNKVRTLEDAIMEKFPKAAISEIRRTKFEAPCSRHWFRLRRVDKDHIVEWTETGAQSSPQLEKRLPRDHLE